MSGCKYIKTQNKQKIRCNNLVCTNSEYCYDHTILQMKKDWNKEKQNIFNSNSIIKNKK